MFGHDNQDDNQNAEFQQDTDESSIKPTEHHVPEADDSKDEDSSSPVVAAPSAPVSTPPQAATDDLLDIKQEALHALTPLVGQLDQTPEEQFRTTMMMIQASDNHSLVKVAYEAAKKISNEKERAQALLDIVNEINYFTQHVQA